MKKIFIISNYFTPEIGAAASRINNLAKSLSEKNYKVSVICPLPNYPNGEISKEFKGKIYNRTCENKLTIHRLWIYPSNSKNPVKRVFSMLSFSVSLSVFLFFQLFKRPDMVIVNSPPLFVSFTGVFFSRFILRTKTVLNVSDLWPQSAVELGVLKNKGLLYRLLKYQEKFIYKNSKVIMGQSQETLNHIKNFVNVPLFLYRNLPTYLNNTSALNKTSSKGIKSIVYAGLLGFAQGILEICENVNFNSCGCEFHIYGRGMQESAIKKYLSQTTKPIYFHGQFLKEEAPSILIEHDAALVPLATNIKGAVPSKIYELIQLEIPILFSGKGDGAVLIKDENIGLISKPGNWTSLNEMLNQYSKMKPDELDMWKKNQRNLHMNKFNYKVQFENLIFFLTRISI